MQRFLTKSLAFLAFIASATYAQALPPQSFAKDVRTTSLDHRSDEEQFCPQGRDQIDEAHFANYVIRTFRGTNFEGCVQIIKSGAVVYSLTSANFKIGNNFEDGTPIPIGTDITGAGKPNAIVSDWSGGAHCCFTLHVFELGKKFKEIGKIEARDGDGDNFVDMHHDGSYEFIGHDWDFGYWKASFAASPAPQIILKYRGGKFRIALELMKTPAPTAQQLGDLIISVQSDDKWSSSVAQDCSQECGIPPALWTKMLDLIYGGNADSAWKLFNESWPKQLEGKEQFAKEFCKQLQASRYRHELKPAIGRCPRL
jgi:hypothetical protein